MSKSYNGSDNFDPDQNGRLRHLPPVKHSVWFVLIAVLIAVILVFLPAVFTLITQG